MSTERKTRRSIGAVQAPGIDPLARLASDDVLRCRNPETGWVWFYALENGDPRRYHAYHGFASELVSRTEVADTVGLKGVGVATVGRRQLDVLRGVGE